MKTWMIVGGVAALGVGAFVFWRWKSQQNQIPLVAGPGGALAQVNPNLLAQPSSAYPVQAPNVVRQDNVSQPYTTAQTKAINAALPSSGIVDQNFLQNVQMAKGASEIVGSLTSIWNDLNLSSLWDDGGSNLVEEDSFADFNWNSYSSSWSFN